MITSLRLLNFKPFATQLFEFRKLTLFSGLNSTGKSSVLTIRYGSSVNLVLKVNILHIFFL